MIERLVIFGATGDLAGRHLLPAVAALYEAGQISVRFRIVGAAHAELDDDSFREHVASRLQRHAQGVSAEARAAVVRALSYRKVDISDAASVGRVVSESAEPTAFYLALPNSLFAPAADAIGAAGLSKGSRIVVEKPFGTGLDDANALNDLLATIAPGDAVFRVDHVLGMPTTRNVLAFRDNPVMAALWNARHIDQVEVLWEETLALEGRAAYYDRAGALKDVMQNHMIQALTLLAMEVPDDTHDLHERKIELLRAVQTPAAGEMLSRTRRARYTTGRIAGDDAAGSRIVPDYAREEGVDPGRGTETFAEVELSIDNDRWRGTRFVMRAAKALAHRRKSAVIRFRRTAEAGMNELEIGIDGPNHIRLQLADTTMTSAPPESNLPPYGHVLADVLAGRSDLAVGGEEAVEAWRIFEPVLHAWAHNVVPLDEYPAGAAGLSSRKLADRQSDDARPRAEQ
jgi:glucose-6-phosphate 1-dehydrogenase